MAKRFKGDAHGLDYDNIINGGFYISREPGGIGDALTGIHIPGPKAVLDETTHSRRPTKLVEIPEPVQLPHFKVVIEVDETSKQPREVLKPFNAKDKQPVHELFMNALMSGQIRYVSEEEMQEKFPDTWAARHEKLIWRDPSIDPDRPYSDMFEDALEAEDFARNQIAEVQDQIAKRNAVLAK